MPNKLELTWYGKDDPIRVEPRLLIENAALSNTAADPGPVLLLLALLILGAGTLAWLLIRKHRK